MGGCPTNVRSAPAVEDRPIGSEEPWSVVRHLDGEPSVVHETVVAPAEKDEVVDARRAAVGPMTNVMGGFKSSSQQLPRASPPASSNPASYGACR